MSTMLFASDEARWDAVVRRDRSADGAFWYGVRTTGVYCRPWCASRAPRRENVLFFADCDEAECAGLRPCKRCRPRDNLQEPHTAAITRACRMLDEAETPPKLAELAREIGLSPYHFHRQFKAIVGVTPRQYVMSRRLSQVRKQLHEDEQITEAFYNAGFASSAGFYAQSGTTLGMTPSEYRDGAPGQFVRYAVAPCYLGLVLIAATARGICLIEFGDSPTALIEMLQQRFPRAQLEAGDEVFSALVGRVVAFIEAPERGLELPLDIQGTAFQRRVWQALREIPPGATASYSEIAIRIGSPGAVRAVAGACAANRLAVVIPCHRVVRSNGDLSGYRWGTTRKRTLLERERAPEGQA